MRSASAGAPVAATAVAAAPSQQPEAAPESAPQLDLERLRLLWAPVIDAVREENAMVGALLGDARPASLEDGRLTISFPRGAEFSKRKADSNRDLLKTALHTVTGHSLAIEFELSGEDPEQAPVLSEDELLERLKNEFGAEELSDDEPPPT